MRSSTETIIGAMKILLHDIYCEDGVATAAIAEAADRLEEIAAENKKLKTELQEAKDYADRLVEHKDMVCLPADLANLREANAHFAKEINRLESRCSNLQAVVNGDAYNIKRLSEINERLVDACSISEMELETLQGEIEMTYRYYTGFGAKKDLTTTQMLNHILKNVPNYQPTKEEHDLEDMKRHCDHYIKALEEITKKNRKAETCRMIALKALGELDDSEYQPELLIEENLKLRIQVEDLESKIIKYSIDKVFNLENVPLKDWEGNPITHCQDCGEYWGYHHEEYCKGKVLDNADKHSKMYP